MAMSLKRDAGGAVGSTGCARIRADLERRGLAPEFSRAFAERLAPLSQGLSAEAYAAALDAVALAWGDRDSGVGAQAPRGAGELNELQRLMAGFVGELRKLEEALRILDAYLARMRTQTRVPEVGTLH
jgi:hypothetical protein